MKPNILVTNDDGISWPGLQALARALSELGEVTVVAPDQNWSISGHQKALSRFLRADPYTLPFPGLTAFASNGSPADCVALAYLGLLERTPDIVVSGMNRGPNLGQDITYSGTVAAAFEAAIFGYPAVAVSLDSRDPDADFTSPAQVATRVVRRVMEKGLPQHTLLNVNIPGIPASEWQGIAVTRLGVRDYRDRLIIDKDPDGRPYYWIAGQAPGGDIDHEGTDIWAVHHGYVSVTPIQLDMTEENLLGEIRDWNL